MVSIGRTGQKGITDAPRCLSAHHRGIVVTIIAVNVEIGHFSAIGDQVADRVHGISLDDGRERSHLALSTRVPDHTLDKSLATSDRIEVNLSGRVLELHGALP